MKGLNYFVCNTNRGKICIGSRTPKIHTGQIFEIREVIAEESNLSNPTAFYGTMAQVLGVFGNRQYGLPYLRMRTFELDVPQAFYVAQQATNSPVRLNYLDIPETSSTPQRRPSAPVATHTSTKGGTSMKKNLFGNLNLDMGKITDDTIKMSARGPAFHTGGGNYATYENGDLTDVTAMLLPIDLMFKMPVAIKDVKVGDIVRHANDYVVVTKVDDGKFEVVHPKRREVATILPLKNMFGINYLTKVISLAGDLMKGIGGDANADNPFGAYLPMLALGGDMDMKDILLMTTISKGGNIDPMMMMLLAGEGNIDPMMLMAMNGGGDMSAMLPLLLCKDGGNDMGMFLAMQAMQKATTPVAPATPAQTED